MGSDGGVVVVEGKCAEVGDGVAVLGVDILGIG